MTGADFIFLLLGISLFMQRNRKEAHSNGSEILRSYLNKKLSILSSLPSSQSAFFKAPKSAEISFFDPTVFCETDLYNQNQQLIAKRGDSFNPLIQIPFCGKMWVLDGACLDHVQWAAKQEEICLMVGRKPAQGLITRNMLFDPIGLMSQTIKVKSMPSCVFQKGDLLHLQIVPEIGRRLICH